MLARRSPVPVELDLKDGLQLPQRLEVAAYYVVSEALTNVAKHARATVVQVELKAENSTAELEIRDDGVGGANPDRGSGLIGLVDRVEAIGGTIRITSRPGAGTSLLVTLPIADDQPIRQTRTSPRRVEVHKWAVEDRYG
jgi:signal transduction histidine kinase